MLSQTPVLPKLHGCRQLHSRLFVAAMAVVALFSRSLLADYAVWQHMLVWLGYGLIVAGVLGRVYSSAYIGGSKNQELIRQGPYSIVRNPLYFCSFLAMAGVGLQSGMVTLAVLLAIGFVLYYPQVVAKEEALLRYRFAGYTDYCRDVPRWIPKFSLWSEPEQMVVKPKFLRRTVMDAMVFFLPLPCFSVLGNLQAENILPVWLLLP